MKDIMHSIRLGMCIKSRIFSFGQGLRRTAYDRVTSIRSGCSPSLEGASGKPRVPLKRILLEVVISWRMHFYYNRSIEIICPTQYICHQPPRAYIITNHPSSLLNHPILTQRPVAPVHRHQHRRRLKGVNQVLTPRLSPSSKRSKSYLRSTDEQCHAHQPSTRRQMEVVRKVTQQAKSTRPRQRRILRCSVRAL